MFQNSILRNIHYKTHEILKFNYLKKKKKMKERKEKSIRDGFLRS